MSEWSVYRCILRKAQKNHSCCECFGLILKGEKYHYHSGIFEGQGESYKECIDCHILRNEVDEGCNPEERTHFNGLCDSICDNCDDDLFIRYFDIAKKRGANIGEWMQKKITRINEVIENKT